MIRLYAQTAGPPQIRAYEREAKILLFFLHPSSLGVVPADTLIRRDYRPHVGACVVVLTGLRKGGGV